MFWNTILIIDINILKIQKNLLRSFETGFILWMVKVLIMKHINGMNEGTLFDGKL